MCDCPVQIRSQPHLDSFDPFVNFARLVQVLFVDESDRGYLLFPERS